ncbi:MAG: energy-coupling factor transporter transmembrane component T [Berryella intestinalis]|uniref:energy-coupling factor transporter transmembrane component T family protein n=1 Tax=Berryella intestinalis TaxID=1531429 RepID=UPI002A588A34|nr:energy-coupling factor transporter transmembrane component T [Berryella intestinalis]MDD7369342.1 energy-coupling factor transporter transmembrane component T [Berryella intestinalis]MDY3130045.1 energy-coupling factor transporter transmembrane component T [Berryella intestinalis]
MELVGDAVDDRGGRFSVATKVWVLVLVIAATMFGLTDAAQAFLSLASIAYAACAGRLRIACWLAASFAVVAAIYVSFACFGMRPLFFSPLHISQSWHSFPAVAALSVLVTSPPGTVSAALARVGCPKKGILGVLVMLRFVPTFASSWRLLRDSLRKRGLLAVRQVVGNPLGTYEYVMVPSIMALINSADQLSSSAVTRAAEAPTSRTSYYCTSMTFADWAFMAAWAVACAAAVALGRAA